MWQYANFKTQYPWTWAIANAHWADKWCHGRLCVSGCVSCLYWANLLGDCVLILRCRNTHFSDRQYIGGRMDTLTAQMLPYLFGIGLFAMTGQLSMTHATQGWA